MLQYIMRAHYRISCAYMHTRPAHEARGERDECTDAYDVACHVQTASQVIPSIIPYYRRSEMKPCSLYTPCSFNFELDM